MYQKIQIIGYLGKDPNMRYTPSGEAITSFSVATSRSWKDAQGEMMKETTWFHVSAWGKRGEACDQYLHKGSKVFIEGRLKPDKNGSPRLWETQSGEKAASYELVATEVRFLDSKERDEAAGSSPQDIGSHEVNEEDIPF